MQVLEVHVLSIRRLQVQIHLEKQTACEADFLIRGHHVQLRMPTRLRHGHIQDLAQLQEARLIVQVLHLAIKVLQEVVHPVLSLHREVQVDRQAGQVARAVQVEVHDVKSGFERK